MILFSVLGIDKTYAAPCGGTPVMATILCNNNQGTVWGVNVRYRDSNNVVRYSNSNLYTNSAGGSIGCSGADNHRTFTINNYTGSNSDTVTWYTACVDPTVGVDVTRSIRDSCYAYTNVDVSCRTGYSWPSIYSACTSPYNRGTVDSTDHCPGTTTVCGRNGSIWRCLDSCSGTGGCTLNNRSCPSQNSGAATGACNNTTTTYSATCSSGGSDCAPPAPTVTATPSCLSNAGRISTSWSSVSYSNGVYDVRWRRSDTSTWTTDLDAPEPRVITGLSSSSTYYVQVRSHTVSGRAGPTTWGQDTAVTPNCLPAPTPTPAPPPPACNSGINCGACNLSSGTCGTGLRTCTYTTYSGGGSCTPAPAPGQSCTVGCAAGYSCNASNTCICNTPATPSGLSPSGNIAAGIRNITWNPVPGVTRYALRVDDRSNGWTGTCSTINPGDICDNNVTTTSFSYNFQEGRSYSIWVHAIATCGTYSASTGTNVNTTSNTTIHVYNDLNGNGVQEAPTETNSVGRTVTVTGGGAGTYTTNASGNVLLSGLTAGNSTITVAVPSGWTSTTANPRTITSPPSQTANFGLRPPAPVCSGGLTASPTTVIPGQTSALRAIGCTSPTGDPIVYSWPAPDYGATTNVNNPNTTWTSPNPFWQQVQAHPSVSVCNLGGGLCNSYGATITITPRFSITGSVFVDDNKDRLLGVGESNYAAGITISPNPAGVTVTYPSAGTYVINNMPGGVYTISYTSLPTGYIMTFPVNGPPPSFSIRVGNASTGGACSIGGSNSAACDANGNITSLRYGITNSIPWIQSTGGDVTGSNISNPFGGGFNDQIPSGASCGSYASLVGSGGTPGIIHSGAGSTNFGFGQASANPYNWVVGGLTYPDVYIPSTAGVIKTSYNYMSSIAQQSGLTPVNIAGFCGGGGISNCVLSSSLPNGIYISNGDLTLTGASYTFPANRNFVILVNGDLSIQTEVHVPVGSTALFSSSRDITVASTVGEVVTTSTRANVEGYYSADRDFKVLGINSCPTSDRRLNVAGSIVVNAALGGGAFSYERDFCAGNLECPVFQIQERADFILNSPEFIKATRRVWREVAP